MLLLFELERSDRVGGPASAAEWRAFRLFVKERLYRFNYVRRAPRPLSFRLCRA